MALVALSAVAIACGRKDQTRTQETAAGVIAPPADTGGMGTAGTTGRMDTAGSAGAGAQPSGRGDTSGRVPGAAQGTTSTAGGQRAPGAHPAGTTMRDTSGRRPPGNQTESGVVNAKTGASTLGRGVTKTSPTQGAAVTSKGDTLKRGGDTTRRRPPR